MGYWFQGSKKNRAAMFKFRSLSCCVRMASRRLRNAPAEKTGNAKLKQLFGIAKRMSKEVSAYEKEVEQNEAKVQKMRDEGKDPYDIRKQEEVLQESYMMVPDSKARLENAMADLEAAIADCEGGEDIDAEMFAEAKALVEASAA